MSDLPRPDAPQLADLAADWVGAYVHVPFCRSVCPYCDFAVVAEGGDRHERYVAAVEAEIMHSEPMGPIDAVHVGGGTPSAIPARLLARLLDAVAARHGLAPDAQVAMEANPEDWTPELAVELAEAGVDRVSFGAQSFDPVVLGSLGRRHSPEDVEAAVEVARDAGMGSVNLDLIFGTPGETPVSWAETVRRALATEPDHLSVYALTVERGTPLGRAVAAGAPGPDPDGQADAWEVAVAAAGDAGLVLYETSNLARPGHVSRYNLLTWAQGDYAASGLGAHGHRGGLRWRNVRRLDRYLEMVEAGERPRSGEEELGSWEREQERLLLGLRRSAGVEAGEGGRALLGSEWGERLVDAGVLVENSGRLVVARPLFGDEVGRAVLALDPVDC